MASSLFWNQPPKRDRTRSADPLGFDALREAMADKLAPLLTSATRDADEYLWTLIGLRWARESTGSSVDATIFNQGFSPFERALKQYWCKFRGWKSAGINVVEELCHEAHPNVRRPILVDQRATGLVGSYIVSLRGMDLVEKNSLRVVDDTADRLLGGIKFAPLKNWLASWDALNRTLSSIELKHARQRLGVRLFQGGEMCGAASSFLGKPSAKSWATVDLRKLDLEQARLAKATTALLRFEAAALEAFGELLRGKKALPQPTGRAIRSLAAATGNADPFPSSWGSGNPLRLAIRDALSSLASGADPAAALLRLHLTVTRKVRQAEPWLLHLGDMPAGFQQLRPRSGVPDFRFGNLQRLLGQTRWRPSAS